MASEEYDMVKLEAGQYCKANEKSRTEIVQLMQKLIAEVIGTYFITLMGCGSVAVNKIYGSVTFSGICVIWGLSVMVMVYCLGHVSAAYFNPAVTITFALFRKFPWKQFPFYIVAQVVGSVSASASLCLLFHMTEEAYFGTIPVGSSIRSFFTEIIISFLLMFVIFGVATDTRAIGELAGIAVGMTIMLAVFVAGPVSGPSMNPARSLGPAVVMYRYKGFWVPVVGPFIVTFRGGFTYNQNPIGWGRQGCTCVTGTSQY